MSIGIRFAARSDVGMLREGNEDSAYAGAHLLAVADGMGGHVGGEIASAAAIGELKKLDTDLPAGELLAALEHTVKSANDKLHRIVESDPALQGMGTTLTAMLWSGSQIALVHIGDSRAYLLREGSLFQITHDHTLVQSLVDEGRISPDEAATHPQRSLLLRALDGRSEVEPDLSLREAKVGDRYLLCSDGLSGVVTAETIFQVLTENPDPEQAVRQLIDLANRGGGPDNITTVIADVVELGQQPQGGTPLAVGAAANAQRAEFGDGSGGPGSGGMSEQPADTPAGRAAQLRDTMPQQPVVVDEMPPPAPAPMREPQHQQPVGRPPEPMRGRVRERPPRRRWTWLIVMVGVFIVLLGAGAFAALQSIRGGYYIGEEKGQVTLFRGSKEGILGLSTSRKAGKDDQPKPPIMTRDLPPPQQEKVRKSYGVSGPDALKALVVCKYSVSIGADKDKVIVQQGEQQAKDGCKAAKIQDGNLDVNELPKDQGDLVRAGTMVFPGRDAAVAKLKELQVLRDACRAADKTKNCPTPQNGGKPPQ